MLHLEAFRQRLNKLYNKGHLFPSVELLLRMQTVVAGSAVLHLVSFSEIIQQQFPATGVGFGICHSLHQKLLSDFLLGNRLALHEFLKFLDILITVEGYTLSFLTVSAGASRLLIISFDTLRNVIVDHKADIRLVNTHSESNGRNNHIYILHKEGVLIVSTGLGIQTRMVWSSLYSIDIQKFCKFLHLLAAKTVYDTRFARVLAYELDDISLRIGLVPYFII